MLSDIRNSPYRKTTKNYDVTVTSSKVLQSPNFLQTLPRYSFEDMPSFTFVDHQVSEIYHKTQRGQLYAPPPSGSWVNIGPDRLATPLSISCRLYSDTALYVRARFPWLFRVRGRHRWFDWRVTRVMFSWLYDSWERIAPGSPSFSTLHAEGTCQSMRYVEVHLTSPDLSTHLAHGPTYGVLR